MLTSTLSGGHLGARQSGSTGPLRRIRPIVQEPSQAQLPALRHCCAQGVPLHELRLLAVLHSHVLKVDKPPCHEDCCACPNVMVNVAHLRRDPAILLASVHRGTHCVRELEVPNAAPQLNPATPVGKKICDCTIACTEFGKKIPDRMMNIQLVFLIWLLTS